MSKGATPTTETNERDSVNSTISFDSRSAFTEYTKSVLHQLDENKFSAGTLPDSWYPPLCTYHQYQCIESLWYSKW